MTLESGVKTDFEGLVVDYGGGEGPILCAGTVALSDPPQCGGYSLIGWDWDLIEHDEFPPPSEDQSHETTMSGEYSFEGEMREGEEVEVILESVKFIG